VALARADRLERGAKSIGRARLDLDHAECATAHTDEVELAAPGAKSRADDLEAARSQKLRSRALTRPS
jgi:hypothetical protein